MDRRKFLVGMGSLAAGGAAVLGSGAFTNVQADRTVSINVADDSDALLAFDDSSAANGDYTEYASNGEAEINLDSANSELSENPSGVNPNARTIIFDMFRVRNQGTQSVAVWVDPNSVETSGGDQIAFGSSNEANIYIDPQASGRPDYGTFESSTQFRDEISLTGLYEEYDELPYYDQDGENDPGDTKGSGWDEFKLGPGDSFNFGLWINSNDDGFNDTISMTIRADADVLGSS